MLVLGAGAIGNLVEQTAAGMGAAAVVITDVIDTRLHLAARCGVAYCLNAMDKEISSPIKKILGADGADVVFDCAYTADTIKQATNSTRKGVDIVIVSVFPSNTVVDMAAVQRIELRLIGTHMYQRMDFKQGISLLRTGKIKLEPLITTHFNFQDYLRAYR